MTLLIFILLVFFFFWALPRVMAYVVQRRTRKIFDSLFGGSQAGARSGQRHSQSQEPHHHRPQSKKIDPNVGEYVEFEEIVVAETVHTDTPPVHFKVESQIEDAEWEEL